MIHKQIQIFGKQNGVDAQVDPHAQLSVADPFPQRTVGALIFGSCLKPSANAGEPSFNE